MPPKLRRTGRDDSKQSVWLTVVFA